MSAATTCAASPPLPAERPGRPAPEALARIRQGIAGAIAAGTWRTEPPAEEIRVGGVRALRFRPAGAPRGRVLHLHGGGYRMGCPESAGPHAAALAARCAVEVICPAYRLAPEHPFPAALIDGWTALTALEQADGPPLILSGDSAGGGLAAALAAVSKAQRRPLAGLVLHSPWLDLTVTSACYETNAASDPLFSRAAAQEAAELYLQGVEAQHPLASPLFGAVAAFPPTFVSVGSGEVLADDARRFHSALAAAGVEAELLEISGMEHVAVTRNLGLTGAAETFERTAAFLDRLTGRPG